MSLEIVKQPNGRFAIWNTVIDAFQVFNLNREQVIDHFVERNGRASYEEDEADAAEMEALERRRISKLVDAIEDGTISMFRPQWMTWD